MTSPSAPVKCVSQSLLIRRRLFIKVWHVPVPSKTNKFGFGIVIRWKIAGCIISSCYYNMRGSEIGFNLFSAEPRRYAHCILGVLWKMYSLAKSTYSLQVTKNAPAIIPSLGKHGGKFYPIFNFIKCQDLNWRVSPPRVLITICLLATFVHVYRAYRLAASDYECFDAVFVIRMWCPLS